MIELLLVVLIAVISVSVYAYAYYILKFRDDTKHCPPCEPCPVPVPCPTEVDTKVDVPNYDSEITESDESVQPNDTEPTPCPANWAPVCAEGMTYGNACKASQAGHNNWKQGKCNTSPYVGNDENDTNNDTSPDSETTNDANDENYNKFGSDVIGQIGEGDDPMVWTDVEYWALDESDNKIIVASFHSDYYSYIKVTLDGTYVENSGKFEYTAADGRGVAPDAYTSQSQLVSDYYGGEYVDGSDHDFMKNSNFDSIINNAYQYYGLVIIKTKGYHNVSIGEMKLGKESKIAINFLKSHIFYLFTTC